MSLLVYGIIAILFIYGASEWALHSFRKNVEVGEVVGVKFDNGLVLNRTLIAKSTNFSTYSVLDPYALSTVEVKAHNVCFPSKYGYIDRSVKLNKRSS
jgi:hypothetical protein